MRRASVCALTLALLATLGGAAGAAAPKQKPGAAARSWAIRIVVPGGTGKSTAPVKAPPVVTTAATASFVYPANGSVVLTGGTNASASTTVRKQAQAQAVSGVTDISIFDGEITADSVAARASAAAGGAFATGAFNGTTVTNLRALGQHRQKGRVQLGNWGYLTIGAHGVDTSAPEGARGFHGFVTALDVHLSADHGGLAAGSEIVLGYAEAEAQTVPKPLPGLPEAPAAALPGDRPQLLPKIDQPLIGVPQTITPPLGADSYVFPVYGPASYVDNYGSQLAPDVNYHHGDDIFGELGQPLVAVASGTVFSVGWNRVGGNRLWLRDQQGNEFYYAHLAAFSTLIANGAKVRAGQVVGFMGDTGDAGRTPTHLHFEVHPVSLLFLGYDGAVDPTTYLQSWRRLESLAFPVSSGWAPSVPGRAKGPPPGAYLVGVSDISSASGLDPASLVRALHPRAVKPPAGRP
jgi:murein DD-endopeptidase MepM/ murein hydrolase activator NlpD